MGNWNISVQGIGCHHNADHPNDANKMAEKFVADLRAAGHTIESATFTCGGKEQIAGTDVNAHENLKALAANLEGGDVDPRQLERLKGIVAKL